MAEALTCVCYHPHGECVACGCPLLAETPDDVRERGLRKVVAVAVARMAPEVAARKTIVFLLRRLDEARAALKTKEPR